jgi:hypothetical protein
MPHSVALISLLLCSSLSLHSAQPDRLATLKNARKTFESSIAKAERTLLDSIDGAINKARKSKNNAAVDKLTYERDQFLKQYLLPTAVSTKLYLKQRAQAIDALEAAYKPAIKELIRTKKTEDAEALEDSLHKLVSGCRGYGLSIPDLEDRPVLVIESKASGLVIETEKTNGTGNLVLGPKVGRQKPNQCWYIEREEKGYVIRNMTSKDGFHVPWASNDSGVVPHTWPPHGPVKETIKGSQFRIVDGPHDVALGGAWNDLVLGIAEKKVKGVSTVYLEQQKAESPLPSKQRWIISEAR